MSTHLPSPTIERTAKHIRQWVAIVGNVPGPKPMALPRLMTRDPAALARIALRTVYDGIREDRLGLARLALVIGATAEHEAAGEKRGTAWGTEAQVRVGLALIDCTMRATWWFSLKTAPDGSSRATMRLGSRLVLEVKPGAMDAVRHRLEHEVPVAEGYQPTSRGLAPPCRTIRTLMGRQSVQVALTASLAA